MKIHEKLVILLLCDLRSFIRLSALLAVPHSIDVCHIRLALLSNSAHHIALRRFLGVEKRIEVETY
jgi:hypothetical protein